eukprot:3922464-Amphidinium_carterae.1
MSRALLRSCSLNNLCAASRSVLAIALGLSTPVTQWLWLLQKIREEKRHLKQRNFLLTKGVFTDFPICL